MSYNNDRQGVSKVMFSLTGLSWVNKRLLNMWSLSLLLSLNIIGFEFS